MKKIFGIYLLLFAIFFLFLPTYVNASSITNTSVKIIEPQDIRRMWIEKHPVPGDGPATYYYRNGYWHGYLQKVGFFPSPNQAFSYYSGYVYPVDSAIPIPANLILSE
ncbi:hypothetical protein [Ignavigranum ruoffiae]|uniref:hypothetical protein n=1 Tax=Ignavigranum ruoffiae TaxID=89093 RepID=UPI0024ADE11F|nr:hypothetical protein [Ignavigranum ruoffiae]